MPSSHIEEPKRCPFCATLPTVEPPPNPENGDEFIVLCESRECGVQPSVSHRMRDVAVGKWNVRRGV